MTVVSVSDVNKTMPRASQKCSESILRRPTRNSMWRRLEFSYHQLVRRCADKGQDR